MKRLIFALLFVLPSPAFADIVFDNYSAGTDNGGTTSSITWTHIASGSNRAGFVTILGDTIGGSDNLTAVTWGGTAMNLAAKITTGPNRFQYLYYLALGTGVSSQTISVTAGTMHYLIGCSISYSGVLQSGMLDATPVTQVSGSSSATTLTTSITTATTNAWTILSEAGYDSGNLPTAGSGSVFRTGVVTNGEPALFDSGVNLGAAGSKSMTTNRGGTSAGGIEHILIAIKPDGVVTGTTGTWTLVSTTSAGSGNGSSVTTGTIDTTNANLLLMVAGDNVSNTACTPSDNKSNTPWVPRRSDPNVASGIRLVLYEIISPASVGTGHSFTCTGSANSFPSIAVMAWTGSNAISFGVNIGTGSGTLATTFQPGSMTPTVNNTLLVTAATFDGSATASSASGFTLQTNVADSGGVHFGIGFASLNQTTAAAINPTWTVSANAHWTADDVMYRLNSSVTATGPKKGSLALLGVGR